MSDTKVPSYEDRVKSQADLEESLQLSLTPEQRIALEKIRASEAANLESQKETADEALAQRVAEILATKMRGPTVHGTTIGQPARVVGHMRLQCKNCPENRPADHPGHAGGCGGDVKRSHDFYGIHTVITEVDSLAAHHAIHIDGTVAYPA